MGGNMVEIQGTGFRLPDPPPASGPVPTPPPTVAVTFGAIPGTPIVVSDSRLFVPAPKGRLYDTNGLPLTNLAADITITNLDNAGVSIPGETVTSTNAYTYTRPDVSGENQSDLTRLVRALLRLLKSEVTENVVLEINTDYDVDLSTPQPAHATLPAISVIGPEQTENTFYRDWSDRVEIELTAPDKYLVQRRYHTVDLTFDIVGYSDNEVEFLNLMALTEEWKDRNQKLCVDCVPSAPEQGQICYDFEFGPNGQFKTEKQSGTALNSNLKVFRGQVVVMGFNYTGLPGVTNDKGMGATSEVAADGVILDDTDQTGDNIPDDLVQARRGPPQGSV